MCAKSLDNYFGSSNLQGATLHALSLERLSTGLFELRSTGQVRTSGPTWDVVAISIEDEMVGAVGFEPTTSTV
jgi:hypothetical protein